MHGLVINLAETNQEFIDFEKGTYNAFSERNPDNWLCHHYHLIDNCRYQSKISYNNQRVYIAVEDSKIIAGASLNYNTNIKLQLEEIGFTVPKEIISEKFCEGLLFFTLRNTEISPFKTGIELRNYMMNDIKKMNIKTILGTCSEDKRFFYTKFGYMVIDEIINIDKEKKYLLRMDI